MTDGYLAARTSWYQGLNTGGILLRPRNTGSDGPAYVARPCRYKLRIGGAFGNCGAIDPTMQDTASAICWPAIRFFELPLPVTVPLRAQKTAHLAT